MKALMRTLPFKAIAVLLAVALATSGFAHRIQTPSDQAALNIVAALGLDASDICGDLDSDVALTDCEACLLHASMSLPEPAVSLIMAELSLDPADRATEPPVLHAMTAGANHPARAPPLV